MFKLAMMKLRLFRSAASLAVILLLGLSLLAACGDATTPPATVAPTVPARTSEAPAGATTAASSSTAATAASGATTAAAGASGATTAAAGASPATACSDPVTAAAPAASSAKPTPTGSALADLPNLIYSGSRELKASEATNKQVLTSLNDPRGEETLGKFTGDKVSFAFTGDAFDKVEAFYRKALEDAGWQAFKAESDPAQKQALLVYQKSASKVVLSLVTLDSIEGYPAEFKDSFKKGDTLILAASGKAAGGAEPTPFAIPGSPVAEVKSGQRKLATIEMEKGGKVVIELCPALAPKTVENFEKLTTKGFYNGLNFHRVEKDPKPFVVQGGDPKGDGTGGPGYQIPDEFTTLKKHSRGTVAMAHSSAANSGGSQFYICLDAAPFLDGKYSIFGQVIEGMEIVDNIQKGDKMKTVTISVK